MKNDKLYLEFENLAQKLGLRILKGRGNFAGGTCIVNDEKVIVLNQMKPIEQRLKTLASSFLEWDLEKIYVVPALRSYIEKYKDIEL
mgnify:CR=1 FL=1